eukprot:scaffold4938_cov266-Pinguiococcus_pyrenoidosus.AAC.2
MMCSNPQRRVSRRKKSLARRGRGAQKEFRTSARSEGRETVSPTSIGLSWRLKARCCEEEWDRLLGD